MNIQSDLKECNNSCIKTLSNSSFLNITTSPFKLGL